SSANSRVAGSADQGVGRSERPASAWGRPVAAPAPVRLVARAPGEAAPGGPGPGGGGGGWAGGRRWRHGGRRRRGDGGAGGWRRGRGRRRRRRLQDDPLVLRRGAAVVGLGGVEGDGAVAGRRVGGVLDLVAGVGVLEVGALVGDPRAQVDL